MTGFLINNIKHKGFLKMKLDEAKQYLEENGYQLIKEDSDFDFYVTYYLYGDRAHNNPENAGIFLVTQEPWTTVDKLLEITNNGPDDIFYFGVARVTKQEAQLYEEIKEKGDVAEKGDTEAVAAIIKLSEEGNSVEYNGDAIMEICGYPENFDDPALDELLRDEFKNGVDNL